MFSRFHYLNFRNSELALFPIDTDNRDSTVLLRLFQKAI